MNDSHYSYARRGFACSPITPALTSNSKFMTPCSPIYYQPTTNMLQYPGYSGDYITAIRDPELDKKEKDEKDPKPSHPPSVPIESSCPRCHLLQKTT